MSRGGGPSPDMRREPSGLSNRLPRLLRSPGALFGVPVVLLVVTAALSGRPSAVYVRWATIAAIASRIHRVAARSSGRRLNPARYAVGRFFFMSRNG